MKQDINGVRTAQDLEQKYDLSSLLKAVEESSKNSQEIIKVSNELKNFTEEVTKDLGNLQDQIDGNITTWYGNGLPTLENYPANEWLTEQEKNNHLGDMYYDRDTGFAYRFSQENGIYKWEKINDSAIAEALAIANAAKDTADSKRRVFVTTPNPPYDVGDIWFKDNEDMYRCRASRESGEFNEVDWIIATKYTDDSYAQSVEAALDQFKITVETDYTTLVQLETTKDSILGSVESKTTEIERITNNNYQDIIGRLDGYATVENVTEVTNKVENLTTSTEQIINVVEDIQINGVNQVHTENNFTFNKDGLTLDETGSPVKSNINEANFQVVDKTGSKQDILNFSGYVTKEDAEKSEQLSQYEGQTVNYSRNIIFNQYLSSKNGRWEDVEDSTYGKGIGFFIGGGN